MSHHTLYAVPKDRLPVRIHLGRNLVVDGAIFLESPLIGLTLHQKLIAFLEDGAPFFPFRPDAADATEFIRKSGVRMIEVSGQGADYANFELMRIIAVTAHFTDGEVLTGELLVETPAERSRLSDCLNLPAGFLSIRTVESVCYANKAALQKVIAASAE